MTLNDLKKKYGIGAQAAETKPKSTGLDQLRKKYGISSTTDIVEEAKAKPRLYNSELEYYAKADYEGGKVKYDAMQEQSKKLADELAAIDRETYSGARKGTHYTDWVKDRETRKSDKQSEIAKLREEIAKWDEYYGADSMYQYNDINKAEDFEEKSKAITPEYIEQGLSGIDLMLSDEYGKADTVYNYINNIGNTREAVNGSKQLTTDFGIYDNMTDDERKTYTYLHNTQGKEKAEDYLRRLKLNQRGFEATLKADEQFGKEHPVAAWLTARINSGYLAAQAGTDLLLQGIKKAATGEDINYYSTAQTLHSGKGVVDAAVAEKAQDVADFKIGGIEITKLAVQSFSSAVDSLTASLLPGGLGAFALAADAGISAMRTAAQNGATDGQALLKGVSAGVFEYLFENISIGNLKGMAEVGVKGWKDVVGNVLKSMGVNGSEEMCTEAANIIYDLTLGKDFSDIKDASTKDIIMQIVEAGLSGALMGLGFGASGNIAAGVQYQGWKNETIAEIEQSLVDSGVEEDVAKESAKLLFKMGEEASKQAEKAQGNANAPVAEQSDTETANADFAKSQTDESAPITSNDTQSEEMPSNRAVEAYTEMVNKYADTMDANGQNVFIEAYDGSVEPDVYTREMQSAYDAGRKGKTLAAEDTTISQEQRQLAYKAGEADAYTEQHGYGLVRNESSATLTGAENDKMLRNLDRLGKDLKVKIQFVDSLRGGTARGSYRNGVISIARGADNAYMTVAKHEISHHLEKTAPKAYAAYQAYALETIAKGWGMSVDALVQETISKAAQNGDKLTAAEAKAEIAADFTEMIFANENTLRTFVEANSKTAEGRNLLQRLADAIRRFIASLKKTGVSVNTEAASKMGLGSVIDRLEQAEKLFRDALTEGGKQTTGVSGDSKTQYVVKRANGKKIAWMEKSELTSKQLKDHKAVADYIADHINDVYTIIESGQKVYIGEDLPSEYTQSKYTGYLKNRRKGDLIAKNKATNVLGDMIEIATNRRWEETEHPETKDAKYGMYRYDSSFAFPVRNEKGEIVNVKAFDVELLIRNASDKKKYLYDIVGIKENTTDALDLLQKETRKGSYKTAAHGSVTTIKISQPDTSVNSQQSTIGGSLRDLAKRYGEIAPGENPAREVHLPKKTEKNKNVSLTARTILEADTTPDIFVPTIEELVKDGTVSFETITDEYAYRVARDKVKNDHSATLEKWFKDVEAGKVSKDLTATGWALYAEAVAKPDKKGEAVDILLAMVGHQRNAAQALQATRILKKMSPEGMLVTAKRTATRLTEEANKRKEKAKDTRAIKQQAAQTDDAVRTARKDAARKTANKFTAAANSGKYEGTPFVFEYAQKVGEAVASSITREQADKEQTTMAIITSQLMRFAREKVPTAAKKSKNDILIDLVNNYDFYVKAYEFAQEEVARTHGEDERFTEFLDSPIGMDADSYAGKIIGKSIADAIIGVGETKKLIREKAALGFDEVFKAVGDYLVEKTGAKGRAENMLRSASAAYVSDIILTNPKTDAQIVDKLIREVIKDTGNKIRNTIAKGEDALNNLKSEVVNTLVNRYNLPSQYAAQAADIISTQFEQMAREEAAKELDRKFKEREIRTPKTQTEMLTELANLGAFKMDSPYNAQAVERLFRTGNVNITIDQVFAERLLAAKDEKAREDALHDIYRNIGRQMPSTFLDKWNAWRYLAMLGNPKTHIRNFSGNMFFAPAVMMKNITAAGIEKMVAGKNGRIDRTKALPSAELIKVGYNDYATLPDEIKAGEKYNDRAVANTYIQEGRQIFKNKHAEKARTFNSDLLSAEDDFFKRNHYAVALAMYCKANNIPASAFAATSGESRAIADNARRYAIKEAKKATFNDANAISNFMSRAGKSDSKAWNTFIDAVLPFRKTPANILVRGIEYSPVGLLKALSIDLVRVRRSDIPAAQMIDNIAAGMTGTGLMIAGIILSKLGVVFGGGGDKDEEEFEKLQGKQNYSLEAWGRSFTLDWLAPEALPFFVGVNLAEMTEIKDMSMKDALEAASNISAPLLEMSCLQSLNDMFESVSSAWGSGVSAIWQVPVNAATSYVTQALPTLFGQVERVFESKRETTYTDNNKWATSNMQYLAGKVFNKLPLESGQIPYIDAWGRETKEGNVVGRAAENLLSPAYVNKIYTSPMEKELQRLYEQTGEASVLPDRAGKKITVNGNEIDLTGKQYVQYATAKGQKSYEILTKMTDTAQYAKLTDADKVEVISKVYEYANALAKVETTKNLDKDKQYVPSSWVTKVQTTSEKMGIPEWKYLMIYAGTSGMSGYRYKTDPDKTIELSESLRKMEYIYSFIGLSDAQRQAIYSDLGIAKSVRNYTRMR